MNVQICSEWRLLVKMIFLIVLSIGIQFLSLICAANFDFSANFNNVEQVAGKRVKRDGIKCTLPPVTPDKKYQVKLPSRHTIFDAKPGKNVPQFTNILYQCNQGYAIDYKNDILSKESASVCINGLWEPSIQKCKKICKELNFSNLNMTCYQHLHGPKIPCTGIVLEGAIVIPKCHEKFHPSTKVNYNHVTCGKNGFYDKKFFKCLPDCGKLRNPSVNLIAYGRREIRGNSPWYVAIYSTESSKIPNFICGGTLINDELVISAAHCFYDEAFRTKQDPQLYYAVVGKIILDFAKIDYSTTKTFKIKSIYFPDTTYTGATTHFASDIAILHLSQKVNFSLDVLPACVYWEDKERFNPGENVLGKLSGFGDTENGTLSTVLLTANLPYISYATCLKKVKEEFIDTLSVDKFCAGSETGPGAQPGDSGGGLLFMDKKNGLLYLRGVVSNKQTTPSSIATFTDIALYSPWISKIMETINNMNLKGKTTVNSKTRTPKQCSKKCSEVLEPLCATDGKINVTFNNQCLLKKYNCNEGREFKMILNTRCLSDDSSPTILGKSDYTSTVRNKIKSNKQTNTNLFRRPRR